MNRVAKLSMLIAFLFTATACNIQEFANKILPEAVKVDAIKTVDAILDKNVEYLKPMQNSDMSDDEFQAALDNVFVHVSPGNEIKRDIVSASYNTTVSIGEGTSKTAEVIYEIQTDGGYTLITLNYVQTEKETECCRLYNINVQKFEASPVLASMQKMAKIGKAIGIGIMIIIPLALIFIILYIRRERASRT